MAEWKKGMPSPNPNGRPKNSRNPSDPYTKLKRALDNGWDLKKLKEFAVELISEKDTKMSPAQIERILKTLFDVEVKLLELDLRENKTVKPESEEDDDEEEVVFKTTAD